MDKQIQLLIAANIFTVGLFLLKEFLTFFRSGVRDNSKLLSENTKAISSLDKSIVRLEVQMDHFRSHVEKIPRLEKDIDSAHSAIRETQRQIKANGEFQET